MPPISKPMTNMASLMSLDTTGALAPSAMAQLKSSQPRNNATGYGLAGLSCVAFSTSFKICCTRRLTMSPVSITHRTLSSAAGNPAGPSCTHPLTFHIYVTYLSGQSLGAWIWWAGSDKGCGSRVLDFEWEAALIPSDLSGMVDHHKLD